MHGSTINDEDLWLMEERSSSIKSEEDLGADSQSKMYGREVSFVGGLGDVSTPNKEDFESCYCEMKSESEVCSIQNPEACGENTDTKTLILTENIKNNETLHLIPVSLDTNFSDEEPSTEHGANEKNNDKNNNNNENPD